MGYIRNVFCLVYIYPEVFGRSQWQFSQVLYIYYRYLLAFYVIGWDIFITIRGSYQYGGWYQIDLKVWAFHLLALYAFLSVINALVHWVRVAKWRYEDFLRKDSRVSAADSVVLNTSQSNLGLSVDQSIYPSNPWYFKLDWLLFNVNISLHPIVTILFWIDDRGVFSSEDTAGKLAIIHLTIVNTALIFLDLFMRRIPVYILQAAYPMVLWVIYIAVNIIVHFAASGPDSKRFIYDGIFNWSAENIFPPVGFAIGFFFGIIVIHLVAYLLYKLRTALFRRCCKDIGYYDNSDVSPAMSSGLCCSVCGRGQDSHDFVFDE